ncbi:hypothetical protein GGR57DRAFT_315833 [Xylariaceae sp. FL1272]|nr:hypothetical protein GGR57DRAFT_315833 [Xylariaceae sp. FL1272]
MASPGYLAPPRQSQHGPGESILIEPTAQHQQFYNQARREADKCRLEFHVAQQNNLAIPPRAEAIARSPTSDSHPSPSTGPSHAGDSDSPFSPASTSESARSKPHRGRRRGPLDLETRVKTAFKRRFKLTCDFHRAKRTSCKCFDFSKLEAGYQNSITSETSQRNRAQSRSASQNEISRESLRDIETFSTGGAAPSTPSYPELDSADLLTSLHSPNQVQQRIQPILRFDIYSQDSVNEMMSTPVDPPYIPPLLPTLPQTELYPLPIGRQMSFRNRWTCEFDYGEDTSSLASLEPCPWTGPFEQLCSHFSTTHHSFEPMDEPCWSSCAQCCTIGPGWDTAPACIAAGRCSQDAWQKRFYGATTRRAQGGLRAITVSEPSDNDFSNQELLWGTPGSSNTEPSNFPNSYASSSVSGAFNESHRHDASPHETSEQHCDIDLTQSVTKARISCENYEEDSCS